MCELYGQQRPAHSLGPAHCWLALLAAAWTERENLLLAVPDNQTVESRPGAYTQSWGCSSWSGVLPSHARCPGFHTQYYKTKTKQDAHKYLPETVFTRLRDRNPKPLKDSHKPSQQMNWDSCRRIDFPDGLDRERWLESSLLIPKKLFITIVTGTSEYSRGLCSIFQRSGLWIIEFKVAYRI